MFVTSLRWNGTTDLYEIWYRESLIQDSYVVTFISIIIYEIVWLIDWLIMPDVKRNGKRPEKLNCPLFFKVYSVARITLEGH